MRAATVPEKKIVATIAKDPRRVFTISQLSGILQKHRLEWHLASSFSVEDFIEFLETNGGLRRIKLVSPDYSDLTRYAWGEVSPYRLALTIRKGAFLSHGTAAFLHDITDQLPSTIYVNAEQSPKPVRESVLTQEGIDRAFKAQQRTSNLVYGYAEWRITVIAGKNTGRMEVGLSQGPDNEPLEATKLERTLIDLAVRPAYAGGPHAVLEAFRLAKDRVSTNVLVATLKKFDYVYPYHQIIGFYMERAGYPPEKTNRLSRLPKRFNFYLTHGMKNPEYVEAWKLFVPRDF